MKTTFCKRIGFKAVVTIVAALTPFSFAGISAQEPLDLETLSAFRVKFLGGDNQALVFNVKYVNKDRANFKLVVLDETGEALFEDNYSKEIDKRLAVPRLTDSEHVIFIVKSEKDNSELSCKVNIPTRVVDGTIARR